MRFSRRVSTITLGILGVLSFAMALTLAGPPASIIANWFLGLAGIGALVTITAAGVR